MDKRLEKALEFSNFRMILSTRQENLKVLMNNRLILSYEGGLFKVDRNLLGFLGVLTISGIKEFIFIDSNDIPVLIKNVQDFCDQCLNKYNDVLRQYYNSYQKLSEAREIRKVIEWNDEEEKDG